jgi:hypothetical protein
LAPASAGRLDRPAPRASRIALPESFGTRALVFVDTEEEFDWSGPRSRNATVAATAALPDMQRRFERAGFAPTYLITYPIAVDAGTTAMLCDWQERGRCAVGTQLHPWVTPPFVEPLTMANSFAGNLPRQLEAEKLALLTRTIAEAVGRPPTVYRAGRYGVGPNTAELLRPLGYRLDVSVRPHFNYLDEGGPDFSRSDACPFQLMPGVAALPLGAGFTGALRKAGPRLFRAAGRTPRLRGLLARTGLLARVALTPEDYPLRDAERLIAALLDDGVRALSFSFHSPSLVPGNTPYVRNAAELVRFQAWWDGIFALLARRGVKPASADEFLAAAEAGAA